MADATRLQDRRRHPRRRSASAIAALSAAILLFVGWESAHHVAKVAHVHDAAGQQHHTQALGEHHHADTIAHLHGTDQHDRNVEPGVCSLLAAPHAAIAVSVATTIAVATVQILYAAPAIAAPPSSIAPYRLAPKTSPPALIG